MVRCPPRLLGYGVPRMQSLLDGRIAVITGAAQGIGRATASLFAEHGATSVIADIDESAASAADDAIVAAGGNAETVATDVRNPDAVDGLRDQVLSKHG